MTQTNLTKYKNSEKCRRCNGHLSTHTIDMMDEGDVNCKHETSSQVPFVIFVKP
jgi:hypothetical protein